MKRNIFLSGIFAFILVTLAMQTASAAGENTIPYSEDFESYSVSHHITNETGWSIVREIDSAIVTNMSHVITSPWFPSETDTRVLDVAGTTESLLTRNQTFDTVYMDVMIRPQVRETQPTLEAPLPMFAAYVNTNENIVFLHSYYDPNSIQPSGYEKTWVTIPGISVPSNQWTRLTFTIRFMDAPDWYDGYFQIQINGGAPFSYAQGYAGTSGNFTPDSGPWFMTANLPQFSRGWAEKFVAKGQFQIDDLAISDTSGPQPAPERTTNGTPYAWLNIYDGGTNYDTLDWNDVDGDGFSSWQEYWAGTDPTNSNSYLKVLSLASDSSVYWFAGTNQDNPKFSVWRSTNIADVGAWIRHTNLSRRTDNNMTNVWTDADASNHPYMFYKVTAPTNTP